MFDIDVYSDCIRSLYKKYKEGDIKSRFDWDIQLDYKIVCQASMTAMKEDADKMAKELMNILEEEWAGIERKQVVQQILFITVLSTVAFKRG